MQFYGGYYLYMEFVERYERETWLDSIAHGIVCEQTNLTGLTFPSCKHFWIRPCIYIVFNKGTMKTVCHLQCVSLDIHAAK